MRVLLRSIFGPDIGAFMDIYQQRSNWKMILGIMGLGILLVTIIYSNYLASNLSESEQKNTRIYQMAQDFLNNNPDFEADIEIQTEIISNFEVPVILEKADDGALEGRNWPEGKSDDLEFLRQKKGEFLEEGKEPMVSRLSGDTIYIFPSPLLTRIKYFPLIQILLVSIFMALGYYLFDTSRKAEQNRVWAGMAKETAHQLGTPISAILAWIEHLKEESRDNTDRLEIIRELGTDVNRLELIADRFSKIGSAPELQKTDIYDQLSEIESYMKKRASRNVQFDFPRGENPIYVQVNRHLFSWVLENLIRNALDAMDGEGKIAARVQLEGGAVQLDLSDSGKGIPPSKHKAIFQPGYSTKKRGWGLGLSLAKRIIENYHQGKIFVKHSKLNEGTTFSIRLPQV